MSEGAITFAVLRADPAKLAESLRHANRNKSVLAIYAVHARGDGTEAYPAVETVAHLAGLSPSTTALAIKELRKLGWLAKTGHRKVKRGGKRTGGRPVNVYTVVAPPPPPARAPGGNDRSPEKTPKSNVRLSEETKSERGNKVRTSEVARSELRRLQGPNFGDDRTRDRTRDRGDPRARASPPPDELQGTPGSVELSHSHSEGSAPSDAETSPCLPSPLSTGVRMVETPDGPRPENAPPLRGEQPSGQVPAQGDTPVDRLLAAWQEGSTGGAAASDRDLLAEAMATLGDEAKCLKAIVRVKQIGGRRAIDVRTMARTMVREGIAAERTAPRALTLPGSPADPMRGRDPTKWGNEW